MTISSSISNRDEEGNKKKSFGLSGARKVSRGRPLDFYPGGKGSSGFPAGFPPRYQRIGERSNLRGSISAGEEADEYGSITSSVISNSSSGSSATNRSIIEVILNPGPAFAAAAAASEADEDEAGGTSGFARLRRKYMRTMFRPLRRKTPSVKDSLAVVGLRKALLVGESVAVLHAVRFIHGRLGHPIFLLDKMGSLDEAVNVQLCNVVRAFSLDELLFYSFTHIVCCAGPSI